VIPLDLVPAEEVLRDPRAGGRWRTLAALAAGSRRGTAPSGRVLVSPSRAAFSRASVEAFFADEERRRGERLETLRARAARMRSILATKRAEKASAARRVAAD
jgi:hypothetical protein